MSKIVIGNSLQLLRLGGTSRPRKMQKEASEFALGGFFRLGVTSIALPPVERKALSLIVKSYLFAIPANVGKVGTKRAHVRR